MLLSCQQHSFPSVPLLLLRYQYNIHIFTPQQDEKFPLYVAVEKGLLEVIDALLQKSKKDSDYVNYPGNEVNSAWILFCISIMFYC